MFKKVGAGVGAKTYSSPPLSKWGVRHLIHLTFIGKIRLEMLKSSWLLVANFF